MTKQADVFLFFEFGHLPQFLQDASKPFYDMAMVLKDFPDNSEREVALRKLLEAKDAAVRAVLAGS